MTLKMNIEQILRTAEVRRWHIVRLAADQSVGEHVYCVIHLSIALYDRMLLGAYNKEGWDVQGLLLHAIDHDIEEGLTGDIPSPAKQAARNMGWDWNKAVADMVGKTRKAHPCVSDILKAADILDALRFVRTYAVNQHGRMISERLSDNLLDFAKSRNAQPHWQWRSEKEPQFFSAAVRAVFAEVTGPVKELIDVQ